MSSFDLYLMPKDAYLGFDIMKVRKVNTIFQENIQVLMITMDKLILDVVLNPLTNINIIFSIHWDEVLNL